MDCYQFPRQKILCDNSHLSRELLQSLLERAFSASPPFTGYLKFAGDKCSLLFLFFFNGAPYAAGRFTDSKPVSYSIQDLGRQLVKLSDKPMTVSLCETDPVLLKSMLVFLQEEPAVKAPPSLLNFENIVQQISDAGANAMITLSRANDFNFFFFRDGIGAVAHYANQAYIRPEGMTIEEEVLLYAFQPGDKVIAYIFRDLITAMSEDSIRFDKESLYELLTVGYLDNRRRGNAETLPLPDGASKNRRSSDTNKTPMAAAIEGIEKLIKEEPKSPSAILSVESGPLQGERFTVTLPCTIGRKECDFVLDDRLISRRHAEIKIVEKRLVIEDLASTNGTKVNGKPVSKKQLTPSDLISIGPTSFRVSPA